MAPFPGLESRTVLKGESELSKSIHECPLLDHRFSVTQLPQIPDVKSPLL